MNAATTIEATFREEHGRVLAALINQLGDFELAEDALQDALVNALERWQQDGVPRNPGAWLLTAAHRRAIDRVRRAATLERKTVLLESLLTQDEPEMYDSIPDERLTLMFTCCHPTLALEAQVALTLHTLGGLTTEQVARLSRLGTSDGAAFGTRSRQNSQRGYPLSHPPRRVIARTARRIACGNLPHL